VPNIRVDHEVYTFLQQQAKPFVDTPNSVLRHLLKLEPSGEEQKPSADRPRTLSRVKIRSRSVRGPRGRKRGSSQRAPAGTLLAEKEYIAPILSALAERGGSASAREIVQAVGESLRERLTATDQERLSSGAIRWQNRVQFVRLRLIQEGLLAKDAPRGTWSLTDAGRARAGLKRRLSHS
jgi:hypothetical protein